MKFFYSRKLLVIGIFLHCVSIRGMEEATKPISWQQLTLKTICAIAYDKLTPDDKVNYRFQLTRLIEDEASAFTGSTLTEIRVVLAELNGKTFTGIPKALIRLWSGSSVSSSGFSPDLQEGLPVDDLATFSSKPKYDFHDADLDIIKNLNRDLLSPRSKASFDDRALILKHVVLSTSGSPAPDIPSPRPSLQEVMPPASPLPVALAMPRPHSTTPDDLMPPGLTRSPVSSPSSSSDSEVEVGTFNDFSEATADQIYVQKKMGLEVLSAPSLESLEKRALDLGLSISPRGDSPAPSGSEPLFSTPMPAVVENPVFETRSPDESLLLPAEQKNPSIAQLAPPAPAVRPNSAPPVVQVHVIARPQSPASSHSSSASEVSSASSCASAQVLSPQASAHDEPPIIQTTARSESPTPLILASPDDEALWPSEQSESSSPATSSRPASPLVPPTLENNASPKASTVPLIDLSQLTLEQLKEMDPEHFTPHARARLLQLLEEKKAQMGPIDPAAVRPELVPDGNGSAEVAAGSNTLIRTLEAAGIFLAVWTATETVVAYKNIPQEDWDNAKKWRNKLDLLAHKTGSAMASRPGQLKDIIKRKFAGQ